MGKQLKGAAATSNEALAQLGGQVQWVESFVTDDKTLCSYLADSEEAVRDHARLSGFPVNHITQAHRTLDPTTAHGG